MASYGCLVVEDDDQAEDRRRAHEPRGCLVPALQFVLDVQMRSPYGKGKGPVWTRAIGVDVT